jgi:hypothetical protein
MKKGEMKEEIMRAYGDEKKRKRKKRSSVLGARGEGRRRRGGENRIL